MSEPPPYEDPDPLDEVKADLLRELQKFAPKPCRCGGRPQLKWKGIRGSGLGRIEWWSYRCDVCGAATKWFPDSRGSVDARKAWDANDCPDTVSP